MRRNLLILAAVGVVATAGAITTTSVSADTNGGIGATTAATPARARGTRRPPAKQAMRRVVPSAARTSATPSRTSAGSTRPTSPMNDEAARTEDTGKTEKS